METNVIDLAPLADRVTSVLSAVLLGLAAVAGTYLTKKLKDWFDMDLDTRHREALQGALNRAIDFGEEKLRTKLDGKLTIGVKNDLIATAAGYVIDSTPAALKRFGIDATSVDGKMRLIEMVESRLGHVVFDDDPRLEVAPAPKSKAAG